MSEPAVSIVPAFMSAARYGGEVLGAAVVGERWHEPSVLARMTVGALAGHLYLVVRRVDKHLDVDAPAAEAAPAEAFDRNWSVLVTEPADLDRPLHARVRTDGDHVAAWGWPAVRDAYAERIEKLATRLSTGMPRTIMLGDTVTSFEDYLASRVLEVLVHADDLALSIDHPAGTPPPQAVAIALDYAFARSRALHGDQAVLRAFTRRERSASWMPAIY